MTQAQRGDIKALFAQALQLQKTGQTDAALAQFTNIVLQRPQTAEAHFQIGVIHAQSGRRDKADAALRRALALKPAEPAIWKALASVTAPSDRDALMVEIAAGLPAPDQAKMGNGFWREGRTRAAEPILRAALEAGAEDARLMLATLYLETCRPEDAAALLKKAPSKSAELWKKLAEAQARMHEADKARKSMRRAIGAGAHPLGAQLDLAQMLWREGELSAGMRVINEAVADAPKAAPLIGQRGQMRQSQGDIDGAKADLMRAIEIAPDDGEAYRAYVAGGKVAADDPIIDQIDDALKRQNLEPKARWRLHFAMAKALDDIGRYDAVFDHLDRANAEQSAAFPYDFDAVLTRAQKQLAAFRDHLVGANPKGSPGPVFFVTGLPRSGTTLVETILAAHPMVEAGGELPFMSQALAPLIGVMEQGAPVQPSDFTLPGALYLQAARRRSGATLAFTDKSIATFARIGFVAFALPEARFFVLRRDPRDIGLSAYRNMFADGTQRFSNDLFTIGRFIRLEQAMIAAWQDMMPERIDIVDYEALTDDPEPHIRRIVAAAGLPWDPACLVPHKAKHRVETLSFAQVRQPIYRSSVAGWRRYPDKLGRLDEGLAAPLSL
ncbi:MAG: sulfotransferase [Pseudomonadota bacterium]